MANYQIAYPALLPLASGEPDSPAPAIAAETPLNDGDMVAATRQVKRRRMLHVAHRATTPEVQAAVKRKFSVHAENAAGAVDAVAMPPWALAMQNQIQNTLNQNMQAIRNEVQAIRNEVQDIRTEVNDNQRMLRNNAANATPEHPVFPIRNANGIFPDDAQGRGPAFPTTRFALDGLTVPEQRYFLQFYGLDTVPVATGLIRLKIHLGIRL
eukprot:scaffold2693_cov91-Cylindrotheca_fusiformis.AAC.5